MRAYPYPCLEAWMYNDYFQFQKVNVGVLDKFFYDSHEDLDIPRESLYGYAVHELAIKEYIGKIGQLVRGGAKINE